MMVWFSLLLGWTRIFSKTQDCPPWPLTPGHFACFWYLGPARRPPHRASGECCCLAGPSFPSLPTWFLFIFGEAFPGWVELSGYSKVTELYIALVMITVFYLLMYLFGYCLSILWLGRREMHSWFSDGRKKRSPLSTILSHSSPQSNNFEDLCSVKRLCHAQLRPRLHPGLFPLQVKLERKSGK